MSASGWHETSLGSLAHIRRGSSPRPITSPRWFDSQSEVGWVRISDIAGSDGRTLRNTSQRLSVDGIARSRQIAPGTLIMSIAATVGRPVVTGFPTCIHDGFVSFEHLRAVDRDFLFYVLKHLEGSWSSSGQTGSQTNVNTAIVARKVVEIPKDLHEQRLVAKALSDADDLISALKRMIAKKRAVKQGMMQRLLSGETRLPGFTAHWQGVIIGDLAKQHRRVVDPRREPHRRFQHFSLPAFDDGGMPSIEMGSSIDSIKFAVPAAAVLVSKLNPRIQRVWAPDHVGPNAIASTEFVVMTPNEDTDRSFLKWLMKSHAVASRMKVLAAGTTGSHARIHSSQVAAIEVGVPELAEQVEIGMILDDASREINKLRARLVKAGAVRHGMMQQLLSGSARLPFGAAA